MNTRAFFLLILLLVGSGTAGCLRSTIDSERPLATVVVVGDACTVGVHHCTHTAGALVISGDIRAIHDEIAAIRIEDPTTAVRIQGADVGGAPVGVVVVGNCIACEVAIVGSDLTATVVGIDAGDWGGLLIVRDSYIRIEPNETETKEPTVPHEYAGISMGPRMGEIRLEKVDLLGEFVNGTGLLGRSPSAFSASELSISGFRTAIWGSWLELGIRDSTIVCSWLGIIAVRVREVSMANTAVDGCQAPALHSIALGAIGNMGNVAELVKVRASQGISGIQLADFNNISLHELNVSNNEAWGIVVSADSVSITDSIVNDNRAWGIDVQATTSAIIQRTSITRNGLDSEALPGDGAGLRILGVDSGSYQVVDSSIAGNRVWGIIAPQTGVVVEARNNWWGSPLGPSPPTPAALGNPNIPGFGDSVYGVVVTAPHLIAPP